MALQRRLAAALSEQRNKLVAALADEVYFAHTNPGGKTARLAEQISGWAFLLITDRTFDFDELKNFVGGKVNYMNGSSLVMAHVLV